MGSKKKEFVICLDTNVLLRTLVESDDKQFQYATSLINKIKDGKYEAIIPGVVLAELTWVLKSVYSVPKGEQIDILNAVMTIPNCKPVNNYKWELALELYHQYNIKYVDALILSTIGTYNKPTLLATFDKEFQKIKIKGLNIIDPSNL